MRLYYHFLLILLSINLVIVPSPIFMLKAVAQNLANQKPSSPNNSFSAVFVFGDSTVDPGNNDYVSTAILKANFPPYGRDFMNHMPTGRFTNGRLATDYVVSYLSIKEYVPPYLDPTLGIEELMTGVSFASAGSGFDSLTAQISGAISIPKQLEYFKEYKTRLETAIGKKRTQILIEKAGFIVSAGTNDFVVNYFGPSNRRETYSVSGYQQFLIHHVEQLIKDLVNEGAQLVGILGLPPMGCLPAVITLYSNGSFHGRDCIESLSTVARDYNRILQNVIRTNHERGPKIYYADIYTPLIDMIKGRKFGLDVVNKGCCGTGILEASFLCNPTSSVCRDASKYVFWDAIHPTEKAYYFIFQYLRSTTDVFDKL